MKNQRISISDMFGFCLSIISLVFAIIMLTYNSSDRYIFLFVLPLSFSITNTFSYKIYRSISKSPVTLIIVIFYFIRFCLSPFLFILGGCVNFYSVYSTTVSLYYAILIMCLELITVFFIACNYVKKRNDVISQKYYFISKSDNMFFFTFLLLLFILITYFYTPEIQQTNLLIFDVNWKQLASINYDNETIVARGSFKRYLYSLWSFLWPILRIIIAPLFMAFFYRKIKNTNISLALCACSTVLPCLFIGADNISPFIGIALGAITIRHLYGNKSNYLIVLFSIVAAVLMGIIVSSKALEFQSWRGISGISLFAQLLNQYFPGVENGALTLDLPKNNYFEHLFFDLYYAIPFKETLLGLEGTRLNDLFSSFVNLKGTIIPFIFQISYYFTGVGGCIIVGSLVKMAYNYEIKANNSESFWDYYVSMYASFLIASSISIYSFSIFFRNVIGIYVPIKVLLFFAKRINVKN